MNLIHPTKLAAKVAAVNLVNTEAKRLWPICVAALKPLLDRKAVKTDGSFTQDMRQCLPSLPVWATSGNRVNAIIHAGRQIKLMVQCSQYYKDNAGREGHANHETLVYLYELDGQIMREMTGDREWINRLPTDYTPEKVVALRQAEVIAANAHRDAQSALHPFGTYDA